MNVYDRAQQLRHEKKSKKRVKLWVFLTYGKEPGQNC